VYTVVYALYRRSEIDHAEFTDHWLKIHQPLASRIPRIRRYELWPVVESTDRVGGVDGFAILDFDSAEDYELARCSVEFAEASKDTKLFAQLVTSYVVDVHSIS
jgi:uncharacterized protein (TIGR02118 family)